MTGPPAVAQTGLQGHYAGAASRFTAYAADVAVSNGLFLLGLAGTAFAVSIITGHHVTWNRHSTAVDVIYFGWLFAYFAYSWAAFGRTIGMALLGVRVVRATGADLSPGRAVVRTLAFPFSFVLFGLGFAGIVIGRRRRALHDLIAGTAVVYAWDARAARLRFLAGKPDQPDGR